ncbi:asparagine synthetase B family protein [Spirosoma oryzicola]|uniref:asparagine synthetase B family protein n=1 Tax=Spirosoma oryzicola TaxID=2898794 RepID=UPI001E55A5D5|nr:asparagine synthetase B family protein [Spirosoma oryzicola]UHG93040.1 asparagine synthase-related protein [Spirosoma oryzicola]
MGGIAGIIRFDGQAIDVADATKLANRLAHRGKVTSRTIDQGILLNFGGDIEVSQASSSPVYTTADADIFSGTSTQSFTQAYRDNGPAFFDQINGDFAAFVWDTNQQMLICGRDPLGVKPLYYVHQAGRFFAFASEIKALLALAEVVVTPNEHKFSEYLTWIADYVPYSAETFYEGIYSVLPGHSVQITAHQLQIRPYWTINLSRFSGLNGTDAYASVFNDYFTTAIDQRIQGKIGVGAHLSGGLDSSSVSCVAQSLLTKQSQPALHTFTIDTQQPSADESEYVRAVLAQHPMQQHTVRPVADVLESVLTINRLFDRPEHFIIPSSFHLSVSLEAQQLGCDIILTGHDGDSVVTHSFDFLDELFDAQDWEALLLACQQFISPSDRNLSYVSPNWSSLPDRTKLEKYIVYFLGTKLKKQLQTRPIGDVWQTMRTQKRVFNLSTTALVANVYKRLKDKLAHRRLISNALSADFKKQVSPGPGQTTKELTTSLETSLNKPVRQILNTTNVICNEQLNHIGAHYGHQYSFPFFDRNVMEIGLATPLAVGFDNGRGRGLIRHGLKDVLPAAITSRLTKANFVEYGNLSAQQLYKATFDHFSTPGHPIWGVIDRTVFTKIVDVVFNPRIPVVKKTRYNWLLSRIIYLSLWLSSLRNDANESGSIR